MGPFSGITVAAILFGLLQVLALAAPERDDKFEPMVAFICGRPAMHRGVNGWTADKDYDCLHKMEDILQYCKQVYPDHNITNVVEASYLTIIPNWPMSSADRLHSHRVRPFRCLVGGFQSDALLVPQHCEFDHRHDQSLCEGFTHWKDVAAQACTKKPTDMHLESFGMLLNCKLGKFSGVEFVCCPNKTETRYHPPQDDDEPDSWEDEDSEEDDEDEDDDDDDWSDEDSYEKESSEDVSEEESVDLYEAYLRGQVFPSRFNNEHKKYIAARDQMRRNQQMKITELMQEWQAARDRVEEVRKNDEKAADKLSKEIAERFQRLYASYEQEDAAEKQQLVALHQQHVQAMLNEHKRNAMDKYMKSLQKGDVSRIGKYLRTYIKAEEKDRMHTVNHFQHVKYSNPREALRIHPHIVNHLQLSEQRIDQALDMLTRFPDINSKIRPDIEYFMKRFDAVAASIRNVVLPVPQLEEESTTEEQDSSKLDLSNEILPNIVDELNNGLNIDGSDEDSREDEHDYERNNKFVANQMDNSHGVQQTLAKSHTSNSQVASTVGIALGSVSVFVIIVVAVVMLRRKNNSQTVSGYVEVDPSATPEERHLANMQMNGYENPTYKYFEVQATKA